MPAFAGMTEFRTFYEFVNIALFSPSRRLYEPEARTHYSTIPLFSPRRRLYEPEAIIPIVSEAN